jgi:hypothetical protein
MTENCINGNFLIYCIVLLLARYNIYIYIYIFFFQMGEDVIGGEYVMCRGEENCVESFGGETGSVQTTLSNKELGRMSY